MAQYPTVQTSLTVVHRLEVVKHVLKRFHFLLVPSFQFWYTKYYSDILTRSPLMGTCRCQYEKIAIFQLISRFISEKIQYRAIVTVERLFLYSRALSLSLNKSKLNE